MINPVEEYLKNNKDRCFGINNLKKELHLKGRAIKYFSHNSDHIRCVEPYEVGSGKDVISVFTYVE